jgi:hypothetical protein
MPPVTAAAQHHHTIAARAAIQSVVRFVHSRFVLPRAGQPNQTKACLLVAAGRSPGRTPDSGARGLFPGLRSSAGCPSPYPRTVGVARSAATPRAAASARLPAPSATCSYFTPTTLFLRRRFPGPSRAFPQKHALFDPRSHRFTKRLGEVESLASLNATRRTRERIKGGHKEATVRVRVGQRKFRCKLQEQFGNICAFTGAQPADVLDAAHLYSYAEVEQHHEGMLLRKDIHRLFDLGLLCVRSDGKIDVHSDLAVFPEYAELDGQPLAVNLDKAAKRWLRFHWDQNRQVDEEE